jgi:lysylphosphatidylglycerol synthetase-like protein (DUF2156 family)
MAHFQETVFVNHITETTKSAGQSVPGTIIATKRGDGVWWAASIALIVGVVYALFNPHILRSLFA